MLLNGFGNPPTNSVVPPESADVSPFVSVINPVQISFVLVALHSKDENVLNRVNSLSLMNVFLLLLIVPVAISHGTGLYENQTFYLIPVTLVTPIYAPPAVTPCVDASKYPCPFPEYVPLITLRIRVFPLIVYILDLIYT